MGLAPHRIVSRHSTNFEIVALSGITNLESEASRGRGIHAIAANSQSLPASRGSAWRTRGNNPTVFKSISRQ